MINIGKDSVTNSDLSKLESSSALNRTPLYDLIVEQKARFTAFAGWEMPIQFVGLKQEHEAVRKQVGMFDISHMGKFIIRGKNWLQKLQCLVPSNLERLQAGQAQYTVLLNKEAGIIDDIIVYNQGENEQGEEGGIIIVNGETYAKDLAWLLCHLEDTSIVLEDVSKKQVLIALQGPKAENILQSFLTDDLSKIPSFAHLQATVFNHSAFIARTGYTGEDGFEIMVTPEVGKLLWKSLLEKGVIPCGLGARDTLRLEAAMGLYGQDMTETTTPLEAGLGWLIHWQEKGDFLGRYVLEKQKKEGVKNRLVGLEMEGRYIARHGYPIIWENKIVGEVTSGTFSPTLEKAIALAYVPKSLSKIGQSLMVEIRGKNYPAKVVKKPFYSNSHTGKV
jgi:aminomethyltransferase